MKAYWSVFKRHRLNSVMVTRQIKTAIYICFNKLGIGSTNIKDATFRKLIFFVRFDCHKCKSRADVTITRPLDMQIQFVQTDSTVTFASAWKVIQSKQITNTKYESFEV